MSDNIKSATRSLETVSFFTMATMASLGIITIIAREREAFHVFSYQPESPAEKYTGWLLQNMLVDLWESCWLGGKESVTCIIVTVSKLHPPVYACAITAQPPQTHTHLNN